MQLCRIHFVRKPGSTIYGFGCISLYPITQHPYSATGNFFLSYGKFTVHISGGLCKKQHVTTLSFHRFICNFVGFILYASLVQLYMALAAYHFSQSPSILVVPPAKHFGDMENSLFTLWCYVLDVMYYPTYHEGFVKNSMWLQYLFTDSYATL